MGSHRSSYGRDVLHYTGYFGNAGARGHCSKQTRPPLVSRARIEAMLIPPPRWPDLRVDQESWNEAKQRLGPDAGPSELARAAQSVKAAHTNGEQALDPSTFQSSEVVQTGVWDALGGTH